MVSPTECVTRVELGATLPQIQQVKEGLAVVRVKKRIVSLALLAGRFLLRIGTPTRHSYLFAGSPPTE